VDVAGIGGANISVRTIAGLVALACTLAACEPKLRWHDTTGQNRPESVGWNDQVDCQKRFYPDPLPKQTEQEAWTALVAKIKSCMAERGWTPENT
jgi:hypothetical protein